MSTRTRARLPRKVAEGTQQRRVDPDSTDEEDEDQYQGKKKTAPRAQRQSGAHAAPTKKNKANKVKRKTATQTKAKEVNPLDTLPLELLHEILSNVTPKDLLAFARTNKFYRSILMSESRSSAIWRKARQRFGLPDLTAKDFSEPAYAHLAFGDRCDHCGRYSPTCFDPFLRRRLCQVCRKDHLVKIDADLIKSHTYHPATLDCVTRTTSQGGQYSTWWAPDRKWTLQSEIDSIHKKLSILQEDDEFDETLEVPALPARTPNGRGRACRLKSYKEADDEDDEDPVIRIGGRVERFVKKRARHLREISEDAGRMCKVIGGVSRQLKEEEKMARSWQHFHQRDTDDSTDAFVSSLEERMSSCTGYHRNDVDLLTAKELKSIVDPSQQLTDALWRSIKADILAAVDKKKAKIAVKEEKQRVRERNTRRQRSLRDMYDAAKASSDQAQFFPLFVDFLLLPSVKALWEDDADKRKTVSKAAWKARLDQVAIELEDYHHDVISESVRLILSTHNEYESDEDFEDAVQETLEGDLDAFFSLASSLVMCGGGCRGGRKFVPKEDYHGRVYYKRSVKDGGYLGSVVDVFNHLHLKHDKSSEIGKRPPKFGERICLPLHVASTISALLEVGDLSPETATVKDLDSLDLGRFKYENSRNHRKKFDTWRSLVDRISLDALKADRARPPWQLAVPEIGYWPPSKASFPRTINNFDNRGCGCGHDRSFDSDDDY
ncbi:hypothetical protein JCM3766R1_000497 [Sporobolomyces carnicolor]